MSSEIVFDKYRTRGAGYHWEQFSRSITRRNIYVVARYELVAAQTIKNLRTLDVGCGDGVLVHLLSKDRPAVVGVDSSPAAIRFARDRTKGCDNVHFIVASAYHLPFKAGVFDNVVSSDVIEHLASPGEMLGEIKRVASGKGAIAISTPLKFTEMPLDKMHAAEYFESEYRALLRPYFGDIRILKSHPVALMELMNNSGYIKILFNVMNLVFGSNPFKNVSKWRYYSLMTAIIGKG
jgi:ubiquinone/menaquinone biosynthesis C-methylase UbiE